MNDFSEIETELKKLRPLPLRAEFVSRLEQALLNLEPAPAAAGVLPRGRSWISLGLGLGLAGAAAFALLARVGENQPTRSEPASVAVAKPTASKSGAQKAARFLPAGLTEVVYTTSDEGLQFPGNGQQPMRRMRYQTRETLQWNNPATGASLRVSYPSEEVVLIPVPGQ